MNDNANKQLWLGVNADSQLGKLIQRLVVNPVIGTSEICSTWKQRGQDGETQLTPTRASFLADVLAGAIGTPDDKARPQRGVVALYDIKERVRTEEPSFAIEVETAPSAAVATTAVPTVSGAAVPTVSGAANEDVSLDVTFVFPDAPEVPKPLAKFRKPGWYKDLSAALEAGLHVSIEGPPGVGKSTAPEQWFVEKKQPFVVVNASGGLRERNITGSSELVGGKTFFSVAQFAAAAINGWGCILNEVNAADPDVLLYINGIIEVPRQVTLHGRSFPVHPEFRLVVTYNHALAGTKPLNAAFKDRFESFKVPFPSRDELLELLKANGLDEKQYNRQDIALALQVDKLLAFARACVKLHAEGKMLYQITPRRLSAAVRYLQSGKGVSEAIQLGVVNGVDKHTDILQLKIAATQVGVNLG